MGEVEFEAIVNALPEGKREARRARLSELRAHPECAALLLAVNASARDADARSVAADWFEERDEPEVAAHLRRRAALIRLGLHPGWLMVRQASVVDTGDPYSGAGVARLEGFKVLLAAERNSFNVFPEPGERFPVRAIDALGSGQWLVIAIVTRVVTPEGQYGVPLDRRRTEVFGTVTGQPVRDIARIMDAARAQGLGDDLCAKLAFRVVQESPN